MRKQRQKGREDDYATVEHPNPLRIAGILPLPPGGRDVWRMDMAAEVRDTVERVGGAYTWDYRGTNDEYTHAFADLLTKIQGYRRFKDGDNRALPIRGDKR